MPSYRVKWTARVSGTVVVDAPDSETAWQRVADGELDNDLEADSEYEDVEAGDVEEEDNNDA